MHVGSDVTESFTPAEAGTKTQTNIAGTGYRDGERMSIGASQRGRIWSHAAATSLKNWCDWCDNVGTKLLDETLTIEHVIGNFILPQPLSGRPQGVLLAVEWPWELRLQNAEATRLRLGDKVFEAVWCDLIPDTSPSTGPFHFTVSNDAWQVKYQATIDADGRIKFSCLGDDEIIVVRPRSERPLSEWLDANGLMFILDNDRLIEGGLLYTPSTQHPPFNPDGLIVRDWDGVDLSVESQRAEKRPHSIQRRSIEYILAEDNSTPWTVVLDDDGAGEIADIVALRADDEGLLVRLVHCKYSSEEQPGARVDDLYEVCGQAQKSVAWRRNDLGPFFRALSQRARKKFERTRVSPFEVGDAAALLALQATAQSLRRRVEIIVVQPGLSKAKVSAQQLDLLAATESYLRTTINAPFTLWCSA